MNYPIAIMDYGIGGIGLLSMIKRDYPDIPIIYFSDSGEVPYGKLKFNVLKARVDKVVNFLFENGAQHVVAACHSASSVVASNRNLTSIRELTIDSIENSPNKTIAIIGGGRTIKARFYQKHLKEVSKNVRQRIAQQLSIFVEQGEVHSNDVDRTIRKILKPIKDYDRLLLACTHYPALRANLTQVMKADCEIIDPIESVYDSIKHILLKADNNGNVKDKYFTSGDTELMKEAAYNAFSYTIKKAKKIEL
ncbi:glutamate racemase [Ekhidna sp.]